MSLKKNVISNFLGSGWSIVIGLIFLPLYIKYLGMEAYGLIGTYAILQACLTVVDAGITPTLSREMARFTGGLHSSQSIRNLLRTLEIISFSLASVFAVIIWLSSSWLANYWIKAEKLSTATISQAFSIMAIVVLLRFIEGLYRGAITGLQKQVVLNIVNSVMATIRNFGAVLILKYYSPTIIAYFVWQGIISIITVVCFLIITYKILPPSENSGVFSHSELVKVWSFAASMATTTILTLFISQIDKIVLSKVLSLETFGLYTLAATVAQLPIMLVSPIILAHYPKLTEMYSAQKTNETIKVFHQGAQLISVIVGTAACLLIFFGEEIVTIWTSDPNLSNEINIIVILLAIGNLLSSLTSMPYMLQLAAGWPSFGIKVCLVVTSFFLPATIILAPLYGAIGTASAWIILNIAIIVAEHFMFKRILTTEEKSFYIDDIIKPISIVVITVYLSTIFKPDISNKFFSVSYLIAIGSFTVFVATATSSKLRKFIPSFRKIFSR